MKGEAHGRGRATCLCDATGWDEIAGDRGGQGGPSFHRVQYPEWPLLEAHVPERRPGQGRAIKEASHFRGIFSSWARRSLPHSSFVIQA